MSHARSELETLLRSRRTKNAFTFLLVILGPLLAFWTVLVVSAQGTSNNASLRIVLLADFVYVLVIAGLIARSIGSIIAARRRQSAGSKLHLRLTGVFAVIALIPTILVAVFATISVNFGLEGWFSERVQNVVSNSLEAAEAYEAEHRFNLASDARILADYLSRQKSRNPLLAPTQLRELLNLGQVGMQRELPEAYIIDGQGALISRGERSYLFNYEQPSAEEIERSASGETVIIEDWTNNEFRALLRLQNFADRFLYVTREVDGGLQTGTDSAEIGSGEKTPQEV